MRRYLRYGLILSMQALIWSGCATSMPTVTPEARNQFADGSAVLNCQLSCHLSWQLARAQLSLLYTEEQWQPLADKVMEIGYVNDLEYFYLGRAAEGLGYYDAALKYYRISGGAATSDDPLLRCQMSNSCDGISLPAALYPRITAVQAAIDAKNKAAYTEATPEEDQPAPVKHHKHKHKAAASQDQWETPPPVTH
jgi:hypothetical protein